VPWPVAHTFYKEKMLRLWQSQIAETSNQDQPGKVIEIIKNQGIVVGTGSGCLLLKKVQLEAGKIISAYEFSLGHKIDKFPT
jgi:methionyl-tRNA formyltransferase